MTVVDACEVMKIGMLQEGHAIDVVHDNIEDRKCRQRREHKDDTISSNESAYVVSQGSDRIHLSVTSTLLKRQEDTETVDERIDLEMHAQPQHKAGERHMLHFHRRQKTHHHDAQKSLTATASRDGSHHRIKQPDGGVS